MNKLKKLCHFFELVRLLYKVRFRTKNHSQSSDFSCTLTIEKIERKIEEQCTLQEIQFTHVCMSVKHQSLIKDGTCLFRSLIERKNRSVQFS